MQRDQTGGCQGEGGTGGMEWSVGSADAKGYMQNGETTVLPYSTGNGSTPLIDGNGKCEKNRYHICVTESLCYTAEINTS